MADAVECRPESDAPPASKGEAEDKRTVDTGHADDGRVAAALALTKLVQKSAAPAPAPQPEVAGVIPVPIPHGHQCVEVSAAGTVAGGGANPSNVPRRGPNGRLLCQHLGCTRMRVSRGLCVQHGGGKRCSVNACPKSAVSGSKLCRQHGGGKACAVDSCSTKAVGGYDKCQRHGGGRVCMEMNCSRPARGGYKHCIRHGGGKRCQTQDCNALAVGRAKHCRKCGGGKRCSFPGGCDKPAIGGYDKCIQHGGGKRCSVEGCATSARSGIDTCAKHRAPPKSNDDAGQKQQRRRHSAQGAGSGSHASHASALLGAPDSAASATGVASARTTFRPAFEI